MNKQKLLFGTFGLVCSVSLNLTQAIATPSSSQFLSESKNNIATILPVPPSSARSEATFGTGHVGGMKRCGKKMNWELFRLLLPTGDVVETLATEPSLWFYLPAPVRRPLYVKAEFTVWRSSNEPEEEDDLIHSQTIPTPLAESGLLQIQLPKNLLKEDEEYWWDFTVQMDSFDRSADAYIHGALRLQTIEQISLLKDANTLESLIKVLKGEGSYLSFDQKRALELASSLKDSSNKKAIAKVEKELRQHFMQIHEEYEQLNTLISTSSNASDFSSIGFPFLTVVQRQKMLELAQLSAFFNIWGDTMNFAALNREAHPELWEMSLEKIFRDHELTAELNQKETIENILDVFSEAPDYPR
ncbi:hypothetical protein NIES208_04630 [[Limnothrix rosea] IAM M-220]|nr:hypothetical protein NIES208_04630 [[Limnothrix rosea] IAM M-220]